MSERLFSGQACEVKTTGIKCDHCEYRDGTVKLAEIDQWIDRSCPICGHNLLTRDDYFLILKLLNVVALTNSEFPPSQAGVKRVNLSLEMDGSGTVNIKENRGAPEPYK